MEKDIVNVKYVGMYPKFGDNFVVIQILRVYEILYVITE